MTRHNSSCCGQNRSSLHTTGFAATAEPARPSHQPRFVVVFEYTGATGLHAVGGSTGQHYRWSQSGARVAVDPRDRVSLRAVPQLREVR